MKKLFLFCVCAFMAIATQAQTDTAKLEELKAKKTEAKAAVDAAAAVVDAVQAEIDALPGWRTGGVGILGLDWKGSNHWYGNAVPNSRSNSIGFAMSGFAHNIQDKYFWRNNASLNIGALRFTELNEEGNPVDGAEEELRIVTDAVQLTSLGGYRLTEKIALSALADYRTIFVGTDSTGFNNPGYLDIGAGVTWTPINNFVAVVHPLNYNFIFADEIDFQSSLGAKIVVDYTRSLPMGIAWKTNISSFLSYKDVPELSNVTWTNGVSFTAWKGIGVALEFALRNNPQEAHLLGGIPADEEQWQSYYVLGLSYSL